jgi:hypothetical protein
LLSFVFDTKCRSNFTTTETAELLGKILASKSNVSFTSISALLSTANALPNNLQEGTLNNAISACFALSKIPKCRELMTSSAIPLDTYLIAISNKSENTKLRHNCARVLKNFASDSSEAIEEGAVAALIALSLDGRPKSRIGNEVTPPEIMPMNFVKGKAPSCVDDAVYEGEWYDVYVCKKGGAASKGPEPPSPPSMTMDGNSQYPTMEEAEVNQDTETKSKMAFAKMQVPLEMRSSFMLSEEELTIKMTDIENEDEEDDLSESTTILNRNTNTQAHEADKEKDSVPKLVRRDSTSSKTGGAGEVKGSSRSILSKNHRKTSTSNIGNQGSNTNSPQNASSKVNKRASSQRLSNNEDGRHDDASFTSLRKAKSVQKPANKAAQLGLYA